MTLEETLKQNQIKIRNQNIEKIKRLKREQRKEKILFIFIAIFIVTITSILNYKLNTDAVDQCIKKGFTQQTCQANL
jgi:hypothetical protein